MDGTPSGVEDFTAAAGECGVGITRAALRARGIAVTSPNRGDQTTRRKAKGSRGGRPPSFDLTVYTDRNVVERFSNRVEQFRELATRHAKRGAHHRAESTITATVLWLCRHSQDTP